MDILSVRETCRVDGLCGATPAEVRLYIRSPVARAAIVEAIVHPMPPAKRKRSGRERERLETQGFYERHQENKNYINEASSRDPTDGRTTSDGWEGCARLDDPTGCSHLG